MISSAPPEDPASSLPDDPRLIKAVEQYLAELESGKAPSRSQFLDRYPDLRAPLAACLEGLELVHKAAGSSASASQPSLRSALGEIDFAAADPLGDFRIIGEVGRGGMGIVYEAFQLSLGRVVALKVLPFASALNPRHLQRFKNEAQAAAQLHHTNIVPVYAVGHERGVHFYAMQLIDGQSVSALIRDLRAQAGKTTGEQASSMRAQLPPVTTTPRPPRRSKSGQETISLVAGSISTQRSQRNSEFFRTAARLMVQAAEALEHAHSFGVIHRDIKPANLLIDTRGNLWVTDFGLAQIMADGQLTHTGDLVGTLAYMSPEQAGGGRAPLDHRTDIYSLGATLYEMLTLEPLFGGNNRPALLHRILNDEPVPPRALDRAIPIELETIVLKAVSKNPVERYKSAQEMADDLQRFLDNKPILARRPALVDRVRKWGRRHPSIIVAGVLLLVFSIAGLIVNNYLLAEANRRTQEALKRLDKQNEANKGLFHDAREAIDFFIDLCQEELGDKPFLLGTRRMILDASLIYYKKLSDQLHEEKNAIAELDKAQEHIKQILEELKVLQDMSQLSLVGWYSVVQEQLKLTPDQLNRVKLVATTWESRRADLEEAARLSPNRESMLQRRQDFIDYAREGEASLAKILDAQQEKRLQQMMLQFRGPSVFDDPDVADKLQLTKAQRQRIRELQYGSMRLYLGMLNRGQRGRPPEAKGPGPGGRGFEGGQPRNDRKDGGRGGPRQEYRSRITDILSVLTPAQNDIWKEMTGTLVDFSRPDLDPRPRSRIPDKDQAALLEPAKSSK
jgi:eukaryotic-like serine/threonine-protein kinase